MSPSRPSRWAISRARRPWPPPSPPFRTTAPAPAAPPRRPTVCPAGCAFLPPAPGAGPRHRGDQRAQARLQGHGAGGGRAGREVRAGARRPARRHHPAGLSQADLASGDLHSLGFTWADKQSISRLSREQVLEMLERSRRYVPALFDNEEWSKMVDQEVYDIRRLPADAACGSAGRSRPTP
jgi:hypothetical protein